MSIGGIQFTIRRVGVPLFQQADDVLRLIGRIEPVRLEGNNQKPGVHCFSPAESDSGRTCQIIYHLGNVEIGIGVKALGKVQSPVMQIFFHLKSRIESKAEFIALFWRRENFSSMDLSLMNVI